MEQLAAHPQEEKSVKTRSTSKPRESPAANLGQRGAVSSAGGHSPFGADSHSRGRHARPLLGVCEPLHIF